MIFWPFTWQEFGLFEPAIFLGCVLNVVIIFLVLGHVTGDDGLACEAIDTFIFMCDIAMTAWSRHCLSVTSHVGSQSEA